MLTELQHIGRDAWHLAAEVEGPFQPRQAPLEREHLVVDSTAQEFDNGRRKRGVVKHGNAHRCRFAGRSAQWSC